MSEEKQNIGKSPWPVALSSIIFSLTTIYLNAVYSSLRWGIIENTYIEIGPQLKDKLLSLLNMLEYHRIFGLLSLVFAIWAVTCKPRWLGILCILLSLFAIFIAFIIM